MTNNKAVHSNTFEKLVFISLIISSIAPIIPYGVLFSNFNVGDVLFVFLAGIYFINKKKIIVNYITIFPIFIFFTSLLSLVHGLIFLEFIESINVGFAFRWLYYAFIIFFIGSYANSQQKIQQVFQALLFGLVITLILVWFEWSLSPTHLGVVPMLHTPHNFANFPINRNYIGFFISIGSSLACSMFLIESRFKEKVLYLVIAIFFLVSALLTFSKGTWLSSFFFIVSFFIVRSFLKKDLKVIIVLVTLFAIISAFISIDLIDTSVLVEKILNRITGSSSTNSDRLLYAQEALHIGGDNFVFGVGAGAYRDASLFYGYHDTKDPHNALLWIFSELGIFSLASFILVCFTSFIFLIIKSKKSANVKFITLSIFVPLILNMPTQGTPFSMKYFWFMLGLIVAISRLKKYE